MRKSDKETEILLIEPETSLLLIKVSKYLTGLGLKPYLVGGFVRDALLGRDTADIDIAVTADALEIASKLAAALGGKYVLLDDINRIARVILTDENVPSFEGQWQLDISTLRGSIEQDLEQRDFTIDAMAVDLSQIANQSEAEKPENGEKSSLILTVIDPFHGWHDLHQGVIRAVTKITFTSDGVRLLRAVRLAAVLGFTIENQTQTLMSHQSYLLADVAGERVREELLQLLAVPHTENLVNYLDELGLVTVMIPELNKAKGVIQPKEHFWDVFKHSVQTVATIDFLLRQGTWEYASKKILAFSPWSVELARHFQREVIHGSTRRVLLKLAALIHDIAKPQTKTFGADGRMRFLGHAVMGAESAVDILERLRFSTKEIKQVEIMVKHHLRPMQMSHDGLPSRRALYRYFRDTGETSIDILFLSLADHLAARGPSLDIAQWQAHTHIVEYILGQHCQKESIFIPPKLIDGHDLISLFNMNPGPGVGELLEMVREAQAAGEVTSRQAALSYIRKRLMTVSKYA
ncbi:CCA tRNA nucleotidyltransferase [Chloroflexota bacterium]